MEGIFLLEHKTRKCAKLVSYIPSIFVLKKKKGDLLHEHWWIYQIIQTSEPEQLVENPKTPSKFG